MQMPTYIGDGLDGRSYPSPELLIICYNYDEASTQTIEKLEGRNRKTSFSWKDTYWRKLEITGRYFFPELLNNENGW